MLGVMDISLPNLDFLAGLGVRVRIRRILVRCFYVIVAICAVFSTTAM